MATIVDKTACELAGQGQEAGLLPISPFTALQFHFGMLLGVDDLETGQAYPRGKIRLHNAWLHREGVVWGFNVFFNAKRELAVDRGLAIDAAGHELHLDHLACLDLGRWYAEHQKDAGYEFSREDDGIHFSVHVVARFKACLTRPVPAIVEPCAGVENDTAYSRVFETVELLLRPGLSKRKDPGYHRLRVLFDLESDEQDAYPDVTDRRDEIQALPADEQPAAYLEALREFAALDEIDLKPQAATATDPASIFPEDPTEVVLADIEDIVVKPAGAGTWAAAADPPTPDVTVRPSHIATATIQELLCGPRFTGSGGGSSVIESPAPAGPVVKSAKLLEKAITFTVSRQIAPATLDEEAFSVTEYNDTDGWSRLDIKTVTQAGSNVKIDLKEKPAGKLVRLIIRGTGPTPLLAANDHLPLGAPTASSADGADVIKMFERS